MMIPGTAFRASGPLLLTHWGMSGPAILRLSSYAARHLSEQGYLAPLSVNWTGLKEAEVRSVLQETVVRNPQKMLSNIHLFVCPLGQVFPQQIVPKALRQVKQMYVR